MINFNRMTKRDIKALIAILLAIGYIDIGAIEITPHEFHLVVRGPIFWRLTSGLPPFLHTTGGALAGKAYLKLQAMIAYLLLIDEIDLYSGNVGASTIVGTLSSRWFKWKRLHQMMGENPKSFKRNRIILMLLNLVVGLSLYETKRGLTISGLTGTADHHMAFVATSRELAREERMLPSLLTPPIRSPQLSALNKIVGAMMILQQMRVVGIYLARGGELGVGIGGDLYRLKVLPKIFKQKIEAANKAAGEGTSLRHGTESNS